MSRQRIARHTLRRLVSDAPERTRYRMRSDAENLSDRTGMSLDDAMRRCIWIADGPRTNGTIRSYRGCTPYRRRHDTV